MNMKSILSHDKSWYFMYHDFHPKTQLSLSHGLSILNGVYRFLVRNLGDREDGGDETADDGYAK